MSQRRNAAAKKILCDGHAIVNRPAEQSKQTDLDVRFSENEGRKNTQGKGDGNHPKV